LNIIVFGAGAIGSLFGGLLSKNNEVALIGRKKHINAINTKGLKVQGKTNLKTNVTAFENINKVSFIPDIVIISVKSFDTEKAAKQVSKVLGKNTIVISLQNGLDNIEKIEKYIDKSKIFVCITTHGAIYSEPGVIKHTGIGKTTTGSIRNEKIKEVRDIVELFNQAKIKTTISKDILRDIWVKGIINSSINPLTTIFNCKNGNLLENPVLEKFVEIVCNESTDVAKSCGQNVDYKEMIDRTIEVIEDTRDNFSSMQQSVQRCKKTEIDSINGAIVKIGKKHDVDVNLNRILTRCVKTYCGGKI